MCCEERERTYKKTQKNLFLSEQFRGCLFFNRARYGKSSIVIMDQQLLLHNTEAFCIISPSSLFFWRRIITHKYFNFQLLKDKEQHWNAEILDKNTNCSTPKKICKERVLLYCANHWHNTNVLRNMTLKPSYYILLPSSAGWNLWDSCYYWDQ